MPYVIKSTKDGATLYKRLPSGKLEKKSHHDSIEMAKRAIRAIKANEKGK